MSIRNHYEVLGVAQQATAQEIKAAFRKRSLETHPDVASDPDPETFKQVASAHTVLANRHSRYKYDRELQEATMWRGGPGGQAGSRSSPFGGFHHDMAGAGRQQRGRKPAMQEFVATLSHPRYLLGGIALFGSVFVLASVLGGVSSKQPVYQTEMVEAWLNPTTGKWEQPAPWDPQYRKLQPKLELVSREKVTKRHRR